MFFLIILLIFMLLPLVELMLLIWVWQQTSFLFTVALVLCTGAIGVFLAKRQGFQTWWKIQTELSQGKMPTDSLFDAAMLLVSGAFLLTPGIITDTVGFLLLVPPFRSAVQFFLKRHFKNRVKFKMESFQSESPFSFSSPEQQPANDPNVIDVEFTKKSADENNNNSTPKL